MKIDLALRIDSEVGEGPVWDQDENVLVWIDVTKGLVHRFNPETGVNSSLEVGTHIGAIALRDSRSYLAAVRDGFANIDKSSGEIEYLAKVLTDAETRFNDGKCDPYGNFIAGTMRYEPKPNTAALYSYDRTGKVKTILTGIGLSNGLCWDDSGKSFFYIDTLTNQIARFEYDGEAGIVSAKQVIYQVEGGGSPDGMTIDLEGNLWVALWGGSRVICIEQSGRLLRELAMPVSQPTSVIFGGANLDLLYITSANYLLSSQELASQPLAGSLFVADVGATGRAEPIFALNNG
jgi:sugar lactone lactonase YvrE